MVSHDIGILLTTLFIGHDIEIAPVVLSYVVTKVPDGIGETKKAGCAFGSSICRSIVLVKNSAIDVLFDPFACSLGLFFTLWGEVPSRAVTGAEFFGEVAGVAVFGGFDSHISF